MGIELTATYKRRSSRCGHHTLCVKLLKQFIEYASGLKGRYLVQGETHTLFPFSNTDLSQH